MSIWKFFTFAHRADYEQLQLDLILEIGENFIK